MTTAVTINPAGHHLKVTKHHVNQDGARDEEMTIDANTPPQTIYIHSGMSITIAEAPAGATKD